MFVIKCSVRGYYRGRNASRAKRWSLQINEAKTYTYKNSASNALPGISSRHNLQVVPVEIKEV